MAPLNEAQILELRRIALDETRSVAERLEAAVASLEQAVQAGADTK